MPQITRIEDGVSPALRVTHRAETEKRSPSIRVKCGECDMAIVIGYDDSEKSGDPHMDTLEIGGVMGTVEQWRQVFTPLLGVESYTAESS